MKTQELKVPENFAEMKQLGKEQGHGTIALYLLIVAGYVLGVFIWVLGLIFRLFHGLRKRKQDRCLTTDMRLYTSYPRAFRKMLTKRTNTPYIRSKMGR